jgi:HlyD family secretion protein
MQQIRNVGNPTSGLKSIILTGVAIVVVAFAGFGGWAATAPVASASIASGTVGVSSRRQVIQHLEGGIIAEIRVRDGDTVKAGDLMIRLDRTRPAANYDLYHGQYLHALGEQARLEAERDGKETITWPKEFADKPNEAVNVIARGQTNIFESRIEYRKGQELITSERTLQLEKEIQALQAQLTAEKQKDQLLRRELEVVQDMVKRGLERLPRQLSLERATADTGGRSGDLEARIARARQSISELQAQLSDVKNKMMNEVVTQLREVDGKVSDLSQRLRAARDQLDRIEIRAPVSGYVVNMVYHTVGGVIEAGKPVLELVPVNDLLLIETRLDPQDIDVIRVGLPAEITLTPYSARSVPPVQGVLTMLSADSLLDQKTGLSYYHGRVEVDASELAHLKDVKLVPGMPAQVMIRTGERTPLQYLIDPFRKSINRAFREK